MDAISFIEVQFPVSKISKESYKERKANYSQTLTGLGKWWGRKPLILVRAAILGLLMPVTDDPEKDRAVFLQLLTMDERGLWLRKSKSVPLKTVWDRLTPSERRDWFTSTSTEDRPKVKKERKVRREELQGIVFSRFSYDEKLEYCDRPERVDGPTKESWDEINLFLGTNATSLADLVKELGKRQFGHVPRVGDAFCGGGSIPFEAARIGCAAYGSDLSPVAGLLTWAALNVLGGGVDVSQRVLDVQRKAYERVNRQVVEWGIEHNEEGLRADAYLYCVETRCPECGWMVPLLPSRVIGEKTRAIAELKPDAATMRFDIEILSGVSQNALDSAKALGTMKDSALVCPNSDCRKNTPIAMIRRDRRAGEALEYGLRKWSNDDLVPRQNDVLQERLYCIRWVRTWIDAEGNECVSREYRGPDQGDLERESLVLHLVRQRFDGWQSKGIIPCRRIEPGDKTDEPIRTRGWTYWHHLFNPRQLLMLGCLAEQLQGEIEMPVAGACLVSFGVAVDYNSRLSRVHTVACNEGIIDNALYNQAH